MATLTAEIFDPTMFTDSATGVIPHAFDKLNVSEILTHNRRTGDSRDSLVAKEEARGKFCLVDILFLHDVAFAGKFGFITDVFFVDDKATKTKWPIATDSLFHMDSVVPILAKPVRDDLVPVEYCTALLNPVRQSRDLLKAFDTVTSSSTECGPAGGLDFILTYAPYGPTDHRQQTVMLPSPLPNDIAKIDIHRIVRRSRGNDLILSAPFGYRSPSYTFVFTLDELTKEKLQVFLDYSTGQIITWRDNHGYLHSGFIVDPSTPFTEEKDGRWRVQLDLTEGIV